MVLTSMRVGRDRRMPGQPDHRRQQHHAIEPANPRVRGAQQNRRPHGLRERKDRRRAVRKHDLVDEAFEIDLIFGKVAHIALAPVAQRTVRHALPAPVQGCDREAAGPQVAHGFEIFLDEFGAALEQADRAPAAGRRSPARKPQRYAVAGFQRPRHDISWHRIGGDGNERHDLRAALGSRLIAGYQRGSIRPEPAQ